MKKIERYKRILQEFSGIQIEAVDWNTMLEVANAILKSDRREVLGASLAYQNIFGHTPETYMELLVKYVRMPIPDEIVISHIKKLEKIGG